MFRETVVLKCLTRDYNTFHGKGCLWKAAVTVGNSNSQTFLIKFNGDSDPVGQCNIPEDLNT